MLRSHRDLSAQPRPESSDPTYAFWTWGVDVSRLKSESMVVHWLPVKFTGRRMGWTCSGVDTDPDLEELHLGELQSWFYFVLHLQQQQQVLGEAIEFFFSTLVADNMSNVTIKSLKILSERCSNGCLM